MLKKQIEYTSHDFEAIKILEDFLPDKIFDAHAHLFDTSFLPNAHGDATVCVADIEDYRQAMSSMLCNPKELRLNIITFPDCSMSELSTQNLRKSDDFLISQLRKSESNIGEIIVLPTETADDIQKRLVHPGIRGLKCYYSLSLQRNAAQLPVSKYLPESAWEVANKNQMCITLHLVRDKALSDPENLSYIKTMALQYPDAVLILAHAARSFAVWTGVEAVHELAHLDNVWFDFSAVCESPAIFRILQKTGTQRCMWGSDFPVCVGHGKAVSIADTFYWIGENDLPELSKRWVLGIENLMAVRQACIMADLREREIEDIFYNNAERLWKTGGKL